MIGKVGGPQLTDEYVFWSAPSAIWCLPFIHVFSIESSVPYLTVVQRVSEGYSAMDLGNTPLGNEGYYSVPRYVPVEMRSCLIDGRIL